MIANGVKLDFPVNDILEILNDIANGNDIYKLLANPKDITSAICYKINDIIDSYQQKLIDMKKAREANKQLMTSLSHDVRTPLTTLIGCLDAAEKGIVIGNEKEQYIETARLKAHDMKEYVDKLFEWFKLNSNEETFSIQPIEISECTRNILKDWIPVFENMLLNFLIDILEQKIVIDIDYDTYSRILNNLIQNVISHSYASSIGINICKKTGYANVCVYDNGVGISIVWQLILQKSVSELNIHVKKGRIYGLLGRNGYNYENALEFYYTNIW